MQISLGSWEPDSAGVDARDQAGRVVLQTARNVYPTKTGYGPMPSLSHATNTPLPGGEKCLGACFARTDGGYFLIAGTKTRLYKHNSGTSARDDVSRAAGGASRVPDSGSGGSLQFGSTPSRCD